jgi:hypothetical protein
MENLSSIFRILVLTAGALWLTRIQTIHAQGIGPCYGSTCIKQFDTEFGSACYDCCSPQPLANDIIDGVIDAFQGLYSPQNNTMDCGNTNACVGVSCGTQTYCTAVLDATYAVDIRETNEAAATLSQYVDANGNQLRYRAHLGQSWCSAQRVLRRHPRQ